MKRQLRVGDTIKVAGITATIADITFQEPWEWRNAWYIEFTDTNGNYRNWKQSDDGGKAYDENGKEITEEQQEETDNTTNTKEDKDMTRAFEFNGTLYKTNENGKYFYKSTGTTDKKGNPLYRRISEKVFNEAWEQSGEAEKEKQARLQAQADAETEKNYKKTRKAGTRRSKDVAFEMDTINGHITLTAKQVKFIKLMPTDNFWENGLESGLWIDVFCDTIADEFNPMAVGAMVSTLNEKGVLAVSAERMNGKKCKYMTLTTVGQVIAQKLGLK